MPRSDHTHVQPCLRTRFSVVQTFCIVLATLLGVSTATVRADIDAWYELVSPVGPGTGIVSVQQGGPGQRLMIFVEDTTEPITALVRFHVFAPPDEPFFAYSVDLIAPDADNVAVNDLIFEMDLGFAFVIELNAGPGTIIFSASDFSFDFDIFGDLELFTFEMEITPPVEDDILLYSGIGVAEWANWDGSIPMIRFADADPLMGNSGEVIETNTPSILIARAVNEPSDCNGNQHPDEKEITDDPSLDCNLNGVLDSCEITENSALDCNGNGVLDSCEFAAAATPDCNANGVPDSCDIAGGFSLDTDGNGIPDECQRVSASASQTTDPSQQQVSDTTRNGPAQSRLIDRTCLRNFLRIAFGLPIEGGPLTPVAATTLLVLNVSGIPLAAVQAVFELISMPVREAIFEFTYAMLDRFLP